MSLTAALYDIHGNLPALEAVLEEITRLGVQQIVVGGDVLPGPMPRQTFERLLQLNLPIEFIQGNGEIAVLDERAGHRATVPEQYRPSIQWNAEQLDDALAREIASWPLTLRLSLSDVGDVLFCHATPRDANEIFTRATAESKLLPIFQNSNVPVVVCGHTHMQFDRIVGNVRVINAGSVGMPFGRPGADWLLLGEASIELRHTDYDLTSAAERIRRSGYPLAQDFAATDILQPRSESSMLELFSRAELK